MPKAYARDMLVDAIPDRLQEAVENHEKAIRRARPGGNLEYVIAKAKRWTRGQTLKVAFRGGSDALYGQIAESASVWVPYGNLKLEFQDPQTGKFHEWSPADEDYTAQIRISFNQPGYWSIVGSDSVNAAIIAPGEASMNFSGFVEALPDDWSATVMHEFGHAFGFEHEHQYPGGVCETEFRWDDDEGYERTTDAYGQLIEDALGKRPGIYTVLGGPPNSWKKEKVDHNLRELRESSAYQLSQFDKNSIMKYYFGAWMFHGGEQSPCFSQQNLTLSELDKQGFAHVYPS